MKFIQNFVRSYVKSVSGNMATFTALILLVILTGVGVAIDFSIQASAKKNAQNRLDAALLAAGLYMNESNPELSVEQKKPIAKQLIIDRLATEANDANFEVSVSSEDITIDQNKIHAIAKGSGDTMIMHIFGRKNLDIKADAEVVYGASSGSLTAVDTDIVIALDATGSMEWLLDPLKDNIRLFSYYLARELASQGVEPKKVRIKIIIFRDWFSGESSVWRNIWHGPETLTALDWGPTYYSPFYEVPADNGKLGAYLDNFQARRGKDIAEAPIEAISHALHMDDWNSDTKKVILLWTDAPAKMTKLYALGNPSGHSYNLPHYPDDENYLPMEFHKYEEVFDKFHQSNLELMDEADRADALSLSVNIYPNIKGYVGLGEWDKIKDWNGVDFNDHSYQSTDEYVANKFGEPVDFTPPNPDDVYKDVLEQTAKLIVSQTSLEPGNGVYLSQ